MEILRIGLFTALLWSFAGAPAAADDKEHLSRAELAVHEGQARHDHPQEALRYFQQAAQEYEALHTAGIQNAALFRNQGNACLLAGDLPHAILAYRRGLRISPGDVVLRQNLNYAHEQVDYPSSDAFGRPPVDHWPPALPHPTLRWLLALAVALYTTSLMLVTRWWMTRRGRWLVAGLTVVAITALSVFGMIDETWQQRQEANHPLVVVAANHLPLRNGDGLAYAARYDGKTLNRGVEARLLSERGDWLHIELTGGETGWVPRSAVLLDTVRLD